MNNLYASIDIGTDTVKMIVAKKEDKCIIIVTHSENVCSQADIIYELKKKSK